MKASSNAIATARLIPHGADCPEGIRRGPAGGAASVGSIWFRPAWRERRAIASRLVLLPELCQENYSVAQGTN